MESLVTELDRFGNGWKRISRASVWVGCCKASQLLCFPRISKFGDTGTLVVGAGLTYSKSEPPAANHFPKARSSR
jgi:hypothetical protein